MNQELEELAAAIDAINERVSDLMYEALRSQTRSQDAPGAKELERQLAKVRRALTKAESTLRGVETSDND